MGKRSPWLQELEIDKDLGNLGDVCSLNRWPSLSTMCKGPQFSPRSPCGRHAAAPPDANLSTWIREEKEFAGTNTPVCHVDRG